MNGSQRALGRRLLLGPAAAAVAFLLLLAGALAFTDVDQNHPYAPAIDDLSQRGIINGFTDGSFGPDLMVKRQQFAKMIVLTLDLPVSEADLSPFGDVDASGPGSLYPDNYVAVAAAHGITNGTAPGKFSPFDDITRAQVVTMIVRGANDAMPGLLTAPPAGYQGSIGNFSDVHASNMRVAEFNGVVNGLLEFGPGWDPWAAASRGEVAQMLHRLLGLMPSATSTTAGSTTTTGGGATTTSGSTSTTGSTTTTTGGSTTTTIPVTTTTTFNSPNVAINGFAFSPTGITIAAGTTVTWTNNHAVSHSIAADDMSFSSSLLTQGQSYQHTFTQPGVYPYHCGVHPFMKGTITVL